MSIKIMSKLWENGPQRKTQLLVLLALSDFANDEGHCWPSMATIAKKARLTERGARKVVRQLEADGWLEVHIGSGRHRCNVYIIHTEPKTENVKPGIKFPQEPEGKKHGTQALETLNRSSAKPSKTSKETSNRSPREVLCEIIMEETADDFLAHRKAMQKPVTLQAARQLVRKTQHLEDPDRAFNESIANGWQGVFPANSNSQTGRLFDLSEAMG
ncbi:helix-turn-helix domain-containing protein [Celeribacter halophilus]|uniref:helix-turn-helix domain-containing protein n=1 Tax=Celeribacter halophilus TaxID=576117 RepID=UPI003A8CE4ED